MIPAERQVLAGVEVHGMTRGAFLVRGALGACAAYGAAGVGPWVTRALARPAFSSDSDILNFALTLEYLEAQFYAQALKRLNLSAEYKPLAELLASDEAAHVTALKSLIPKVGGSPISSPVFQFDSALKSQATFLSVSQMLEDTGVGAYDGAAPLVQSPEVLGAAGAIVQVEARHAAAIRLKRGQDPFPNAFNTALNKQQVLSRAMPLVRTAPVS